MLTKELIAKVRKIEIRTRRIVDELTAGAYHSVFKGRGMEFSEVREYAEGDDVRNIDWNVTARFGHPFVKKFIEERELTVILVVDVSASGDFGSRGRAKNELAAELAACLAFSAIRNNDRVGLLLFSSQQELFVPPRKGRRHVLRLIRDLLLHERRRRDTNVRQALQNLMHLVRRRAVVFLISDLLDRNYADVLAVAGRRYDLIGLRVLDPRELAWGAAGFGCVAVEDAESGEVVQAILGSRERQKAYSVEAAGLRLEQTGWFQRAQVDLIDVTCGEDYVKPLMKFFHKREKRR
jgi:uncharacterized protein (DUF58 family)